MLRTTATRSLLRSFTHAPSARWAGRAASSQCRNAAPLRQWNSSRPQVLAAIARPSTTASFSATKLPDQIDTQAEERAAHAKIESNPEDVAGGSSVRHVFEEGQGEKGGPDMSAGIKADLETIKETFSLSQVPKESLYIGAAGILPYAATSLSTVFLAFDINHAHAHGHGWLFSPQTAHQLLDLVTPIQIGYGAVIISFLGAIHWGMEYAGFGGYHSYRRYVYGVIAPAVAWPTIFMPIEYALITQFLAFNFLYFADARATSRGWFPEWYGIYRFVLTFFVGASIVVSLVGRGRIIKSDANLKAPADYVKADKDAQWVALEKEEKERQAKLAAEAEDEEEEEEEGEEAEGDESEDAEEGKKKKKDGEKK